MRQSSGAFVRLASIAKAPEDWRSPRRCRAFRRFMVPMHGHKTEEAFHDPQGRAGCPQPAEPRRGEDTAPYQLAWFMVPLRDLKAEKALDEPNGHLLAESLGKAAPKTHALQTLRDCRAASDSAKRLECLRFIGALSP